MRRNMHDPDLGRLRVVGLISGSGNSLWKVRELQEELDATWEGSPFEVTGCFSSDPGAKGVATARSLGIPAASVDLRAFYKARGKKLSDRDVRREYDLELLRLIAPFKPDVILLAGYVWATTDAILDEYLMINIHPADLSVTKDGRRAYAGANGVGDALAAREPFLHASSHLATRALDDGPVLFVSPGVAVDYPRADDPGDEAFLRTYLGLVNEQSRLVAARTVLELAQGHFELEADGSLYYKGEPLAAGMRIGSWEERRPYHQRHIGALLRPRSIAVVGASAKGGLGASVVASIKSVGFSGELAVVNRKGDPVLGVSGYEAVDRIPHDVDMAVVTVPSAHVLSAVEACGQKGVKAVVCISAGFKETGAEGAAAEAAMKSLADTYNMRLLGPNCMGICNNDPAAKLNTTILQDKPAPGNVAFVTQSGGLGAVLLDYSKRLGIGFSVVASLGNQADVTVNDLLPLLAEDPSTRVILLYLETIPDYRRFRRLASRITRSKPIVVLKAGRTEAGARAASSHTGSLAGDDEVTDSLLASAGVIRADTVFSAFFTAMALSKVDRLAGKRIAVVTNGGGPGILASDSLVKAGFEVPPPSPEVQARLRAILLPEASCGNPVDLVAPAPPEHYAAAIGEVMRSGEYDAVALLCIPPATIETAEVAKAVVAGLDGLGPDRPRLPLFSCFFGPALGEGARDALNAAGYPCLEYPEQIAEVLAAIRARDPMPAAMPERSPAARVRTVAALMSPGRDGYLPQAAAWEVLAAYGFTVAAPRSVASSEELAGLSLRYPIVAKIDHPDVLHKSDSGGVILDIRDEEGAARAVEGLLRKFPGARGVLLQPQIEAEREMILGAVRDEASGTAVMVGLGGVFVELMRDVSFVHVPFCREEARRAVLALESAPLLTGYRGKPGVRLESLLDQMERLNALLVDFPGILELDLNPLLYSPEDGEFIVADCRIRVPKANP